jgi:hypothetical protein
MLVKKIVVLLLCFCFIFAFSYPITVFATTGENAVLSKIISIPVGSGDSSVMINYDCDASAPECPQAMAVDEDGIIYVVDSVQQQILVVVNGQITRSIKVPYSLYPRDIFVFEHMIYLLDSNAFVFKIDLMGNLIHKYDLPTGLGSLGVYKITESSGQVVLWVENYQELQLNNLPLQYRMDGKPNSQSFTDNVKSADNTKYKAEYIDYKNGKIQASNGTNISLSMDQAFGSAMIYEFDNNNNIYILEEELADPCPVVITEVTLHEYSNSGQDKGVVKLPTEDYISWPNKPVYVTPDGTVYMMVVKKDSLDIYQVALGKSYISRLQDERDARNREELAKIGMSACDDLWIGNPLSRYQTRLRAVNMTTLSWSWDYSKHNYYTSGTIRDSTNDPRASQLPASDTTSTGIPYLWGGWDSLWCNTDGAPWSDFEDSLTYGGSKGPLVSDCSSVGDPLVGGEGSGIDCSGYVSAAVCTYSFSYSKPNTYDIEDDSTAVTDVVGGNNGWISYSGIQPMDIFVTGGAHVLFYYYRRSDGTGLYTLESTTAKGNIAGDNTQGSKLYFQNWTYLSGRTHKTFWSKVTGDDFNLPYTSTGTYNVYRGQAQYFRFTYSGMYPATVSISIDPSSGDYDPDLYIYDSSYSLVGSSRLGEGQTDTVSWTAYNGQTFYAMVYGYTSTSNYTLTKTGW